MIGRDSWEGGEQDTSYIMSFPQELGEEALTEQTHSEAVAGAMAGAGQEDGRPWNAPYTILGQRVGWELHYNDQGGVAYERIRVHCNNPDHGDCTLSHTLREDAWKYGPRAAWGVLGAWLSASREEPSRYWHKHEWVPTKEAVDKFLAEVDAA